jgi:hypothetical protein
LAKVIGRVLETDRPQLWQYCLDGPAAPGGSRAGWHRSPYPGAPREDSACW